VLGPILLIAGIILMTFGLLSLRLWVSGRGERIGKSDNLPNGSKDERQLFGIYFVIYFMALVLTPLLAGAMLIAFGLGELL